MRLFVIGRNLFLLNDANVIEWLVGEGQMMATDGDAGVRPGVQPPHPTLHAVCTTRLTHDYHHHRRVLAALDVLDVRVDRQETRVLAGQGAAVVQR